MPAAAILSQGDEVVTGQVVDTNAAWLAEQLTTLGFDVVEHATVGDRLPDLIAALRGLAERVEFVVGTGGLGPTDDDLTAEAVVAAFGGALRFDEQAWAGILAMYERFGRPCPEANRKQALLPDAAERIDNAYGTAPGFALAAGRAWLVFLPGVPREMKGMFAEQVTPRITSRFALRPGRLVTLRTTGVGESVLQERIGRFSEPDMVLAYRTTPGENLVKLRIQPGVPEARVREVVGRLRDAVGSPVFAVEGLDEPGGALAEVIGRRLAAAGHTLAVAESCTGGRVLSALTAVSGASAWLLEGAVTYANAAKVRALGVPAALIEAHGAVSEPVAGAMAEGMREAAGSTFALGLTGVAGPTGGTPEKPVGTVHIALSTPEGTLHRCVHLGGDRARIQALAAAAALDLLRRHLEGHPGAR